MTDKSATVTTKPLSPGDLDAVIAIDAKTSGTSRRGYFEKRLKAATDHPEDYVFVGVFRGDDLAGFAFAKIETGAFGGSGASAALDSIAVDPDQGLQGLGQKLLAEVESVLRHKGVSTLTSQIDWAQVNMLGFMAHMGFGMAPHIVLTRPTDEIEQDLEEIEEDDEVDLDIGRPGDPHLGRFSVDSERFRLENPIAFRNGLERERAVLVGACLERCAEHPNRYVRETDASHVADGAVDVAERALIQDNLADR